MGPVGKAVLVAVAASVAGPAASAQALRVTVAAAGDAVVAADVTPRCDDVSSEPEPEPRSAFQGLCEAFYVERPTSRSICVAPRRKLTILVSRRVTRVRVRLERAHPREERPVFASRPLEGRNAGGRRRWTVRLPRRFGRTSVVSVRVYRGDRPTRFFAVSARD